MPTLRDEIKIKEVVFKNRLVLPPMYSTKAGENGEITEAVLHYYDEKTRGGFLGTVVVEHCFVSQQGKAGPHQIGAHSDDLIDGLSKLAEVIHKNGSVAFAQLNHAGGATTKEVTGIESISPSRVPFETFTKNIGGEKEIDAQDIKTVITEFTNAAIRMKKAGFDGVQIHSAHGYLLNEFYSPITNQRNDQYGGPLENRLRIHVEIIEAIRKAVGKDFLISVRLGGVDYREGGNTLQDAVQAAKILENAGVDLIDISGGLTGFAIPGEEKTVGYFGPVTRAIKANVKVPVVLTGGFKTKSEIEDALLEEKADFIGVGRAIYKDSEWYKKQGI